MSAHWTMFKQHFELTIPVVGGTAFWVAFVVFLLHGAGPALLIFAGIFAAGIMSSAVMWVARVDDSKSRRVADAGR